MRKLSLVSDCQQLNSVSNSLFRSLAVADYTLDYVKMGDRLIGLLLGIGRDVGVAYTMGVATVKQMLPVVKYQSVLLYYRVRNTLLYSKIAEQVPSYYCYIVNIMIECFASLISFRNCGHIFCGECSDYLVPVPQQQLEKPVRVCYQCYNQSLSSSVNGDLSAQANSSHQRTILGFPV